MILQFIFFKPFIQNLEKNDLLRSVFIYILLKCDKLVLRSILVATNVGVSRHILVIDTPTLLASNMDRMEHYIYKYYIDR
jgi:hypothetical protein